MKTDMSPPLTEDILAEDGFKDRFFALRTLWKEGSLEISTPAARGKKPGPAMIRSVIQPDADFMVYVSPDLLKDGKRARKIVKKHFARVSRQTGWIRILDRAVRLLNGLSLVLSAVLMALGGWMIAKGEAGVWAWVAALGGGALFFIRRIADFAVKAAAFLKKKKKRRAG
ncbi:hypothetical protein EPICR_40283 [Candidatus Desulfarcum epimagneticum]|uniref:Uncharacterized protein n=1 Tax=uncultured Desulfobacteraceae bacterium TaxID=218296 RepID=A0A484HM87_9BACT|nr:hypothetical protein EPICR_40283 [uncultured Desulfobacteraceae bacterium]